MYFCGAGQKEIENDRADLEHRPKMINFRTKKIGPNLDQIGPATIEKYCLETVSLLKIPSLQAMC